MIVDELADERTPLPRTAERLPFAREIRLEGIGFDYGTGRPALSGIDLTIPVNTTVGLAGRTGSGKSTLAGLLLGVLSPTAGRLTVDGRPVDAGALPAWQNRIGYVPQDVFLVDGTVAENIALGLDAPDLAAVERAARLAGAHDFVAALPAGLRRAGRRARGAALGRPAPAHRHRPGALPRSRRDRVRRGDLGARRRDAGCGDAARCARLSGRRTLILIAHRLSTLEGADAVHVLEAGRLVASGPPEAVLPGLGTAA